VNREVRKEECRGPGMQFREMFEGVTLRDEAVTDSEN